MTTTQHQNPRPTPTIPWWTRAVIFAVSATILLSIIFAWTGYPTEHWALAGWTISINLILAQLILSVIMLVISRILRSYRASVLRKIDLDIKAENAKVAKQTGLLTVITAILTLAWAAATWGTAFLTAPPIHSALNLPAMAPAIRPIAIWLTAGGTGSLVGIIGMAFAGYYLIERCYPIAQRGPRSMRTILTFNRLITERGPLRSHGYFTRPVRPT